MPVDDETDKTTKRFVLALVEQCVRNTLLEDLHSGAVPTSTTGDYSDVTVISPYGEIPWPGLSRISDKEMKALMIEITNKVFTFVSHSEDLLVLGSAARWNEPEYDKRLLQTAFRRAALRQGATWEEAWVRFPLVREDGSTASDVEDITTPSPDELSPRRLRDLARSARVDAEWVREARFALEAAAHLLETAESKAWPSTE